MAKEPHSAGHILDAIPELAKTYDDVAVGDVMEALGSRAFGPFLIAMPLIDVSPIASIPGLPPRRP